MRICDPNTGICREIVEARENLASWRWTYEVKDGTNVSRYGMDTIK